MKREEQDLRSLLESSLQNSGFRTCRLRNLVNQLVRGSALRDDSGILQNTQPTLDIWFSSSEFVFLWLCIVEALSIV